MFFLLFLFCIYFFHEEYYIWAFHDPKFMNFWYEVIKVLLSCGLGSRPWLTAIKQTGTYRPELWDFLWKSWWEVCILKPTTGLDVKRDSSSKLLSRAPLNYNWNVLTKGNRKPDQYMQSNLYPNYPTSLGGFLYHHMFCGEVGIDSHCVLGLDFLIFRLQKRIKYFN